MVKYISVTERQSWRRCHRKWWYSSSNGLDLQPKGGQIAMNLGTVIHSALQAWMAEPDLDLQTHFLAAAATSVEAAQKLAADGELDQLYEALQLGHEMVGNYQAFYKKPLPDGYRLANTEQGIEVPIAGSDGIYLRGRLDGLLFDESNRLWVLEHKSYSIRPSSTTLKMDDQFAAYLWMATKLDIAQVGGLLYNGLQKRERPPKNDPYLGNLFHRELIRRTSLELEEFGQCLRFEAQEISLCKQAIDAGNIEAAYPSRPWYGCTANRLDMCAFEPLCIAQTCGDDTDYLIETLYTVGRR